MAPTPLLLSLGLLLAFQTTAVTATRYSLPYSLPVLPREDSRTTDPQTGVELLFLTSGRTQDSNLYFHQRSWLADSSVILFHSGREQGGLMGYIVASGQIFRITAADGSPTGSATAALKQNSVWVVSGERVLEIALRVGPGGVTARERELARIPALDGYLNESCDGRYLAVGLNPAPGRPGHGIALIRTRDGKWERLCGMPEGVTYHGHVQWSTTNPHWLSFAGAPHRLWVVDIRQRKPWCPYPEQPTELVTHESWWVNDQLLFCGGPHKAPNEESHVKTLDVRSGTVRIVGAGSWWPEATPAELARRNWWHAAGSPDGRWVAADNWHGDIMLFEAQTTRPRLLTAGHRTYGGGTHPEVGWDRRGRQVIFASHKLGGVAVCVATVPW